MASTYSTDLKLELITTGEQSGTWGTTTDTNLGTLIEQAIVRSGAVAIADTNTTITIANGSTSAARCFVLALSGVLTNQRNLTVPTINKPYIVYNGTTGGFGVQVITAAGTGIVVPNGKRRFLYVDGTNVVEMIDSIADLAVSGTLTVATLTTTTLTATTVNGNTITTGTGTLTLGASKVFTASNTLTLTATDGSTLAIGTGGTLGTAAYKATGASGNTIPLLDGANTWSAAQTFSAATTLSGATTLSAALTYGGVTLTNNVTGTGKMVLDTSATLVTPTLGVASATSLSGAVIATQADQETGTSTSTVVTPGRQKFSPTAAKAWVYFNGSATILASFNVASVTRNSAGNFSIVLTTAFSSVNYVALANIDPSGGGIFGGAAIAAAGTVTVLSYNTVPQTPQDAGFYSVVMFGDQ